MDDFDVMAKEFDTVERKERSKIIADEMRLHIKDGSTKTAIEYGCGTGLVGFQLINEFKKILFMDSSHGMIEQVKQKLSLLANPNHDAVCFDLLSNTSHTVNVDYIFMSLVLHHIENTERALSRFYDALNIGGHLLVVDIDSDGGNFHAHRPDYDGHNGFEQSALADTARRVGFSKVESYTFYKSSRCIDGIDLPYSLFLLNAEK